MEPSAGKNFKNSDQLMQVCQEVTVSLLTLKAVMKWRKEVEEEVSQFRARLVTLQKAGDFPGSNKLGTNPLPPYNTMGGDKTVWDRLKEEGAR
jgi:hypothetical protein